MRVARGAMGRAQAMRIAILAPCHRFQRAGINLVSVVLTHFIAPQYRRLIDLAGPDDASESLRTRVRRNFDRDSGPRHPHQINSD